MTSTTNIYVLELEGGNYYVGSSSDINKRYLQHISGQGSAWTKKFRPIRIARQFVNVSPYIEDALTKEYMGQYGIDKVRGGSYVRITLTSEEIDFITKEIRNVQGICTRCGIQGHFVTNCRVKVTNNNEQQHCTRCGRNSHTVNKCYATTRADGTKIAVEATNVGENIIHTHQTKIDSPVYIDLYDTPLDNMENNIIVDDEVLNNVVIDGDEWLFAYGQMIDKVLNTVKEHIVTDDEVSNNNDENRIITRRQKIDKALDNCCVIL